MGELQALTRTGPRATTAMNKLRPWCKQQFIFEVALLAYFFFPLTWVSVLGDEKLYEMSMFNV